MFVGVTPDPYETGAALEDLLLEDLLLEEPELEGLVYAFEVYPPLDVVTDTDPFAFFFHVEPSEALYVSPDFMLSAICLPFIEPIVYKAIYPLPFWQIKREPAFLQVL